MKTTKNDDTNFLDRMQPYSEDMLEMLNTLMKKGTKGFPEVVAKIYNLAMQFERELHLGARSVYLKSPFQ